jgi:2,4-dienoyl-CoA reductase-like NADH-dependent reductase (Old Yellow Enzyme family)
MSELLAQSLSLPCGARLPNRLAKAAMTEGLADPAGMPTAELDRLYGLWSDGGAGLLLSGNILVDGDHLERPGNVIIDREPDAALHAALSRWAGCICFTKIMLPRQKNILKKPALKTPLQSKLWTD